MPDPRDALLAVARQLLDTRELRGLAFMASCGVSCDFVAERICCTVPWHDPRQDARSLRQAVTRDLKRLRHEMSLCDHELRRLELAEIQLDELARQERRPADGPTVAPEPQTLTPRVHCGPLRAAVGFEITREE